MYTFDRASTNYPGIQSAGTLRKCADQTGQGVPMMACHSLSLCDRAHPEEPPKRLRVGWDHSRQVLAVHSRYLLDNSKLSRTVGVCAFLDSGSNPQAVFPAVSCNSGGSATRTGHPRSMSCVWCLAELELLSLGLSSVEVPRVDPQCHTAVFLVAEREVWPPHRFLHSEHNIDWHKHR